MTQHSITVSSNWAKSILEYSGRDKDAQKEILQRAQLTSEDFSTKKRLSMDQTVQLWGACIEHSNNPFFGLHFGEQVRPGTFHIVGYTLMNSATLGSALDKLNQYQRLISDGGIFQKLPTKKGTWLIYHQKPDSLPFYYHQIDAVFAALIAFARWTTGEEIMPIEVSFQRPQTNDESEYLRLFGAAPNYGQTFDGILISDDALSLPLLEADEELCTMHEEHAKQRLGELGQVRNIRHKVAQLIEHRLSSSHVTRPHIAQCLNMSEKSLQRRLAEEDTCFQTVLDNVRERLARHYLEETKLPLSEIAELLGFTDNSAFYKAFKRWTNLNPGAYRKQS
ncbi:AraC family transcriptional regulator [Litoribrevibacter albus]|uniref:Transcriptional regulator n=1 Tax=Litoribrevibacter albus TaxID=1473156 RepID=A0AA37S7Z8_9GAMM|nr:AraC family transcriptional regulator [Litoribrevibacter albus]GLQ30143.1 transcriptional regulator [Litoribrevibacter albus]